MEKDRIKQIVFGLLFMFIGFFLVGWKTYQGYELMKFMDWPTVSGEIINIRKYEKISSGSENDSVNYYIGIVYRYIADGVPYRSSQGSVYGDLNFGRISYRNKRFDEIKKELIVHYNPKKHSEAYIEYTDIEDISAGLIIGLFFLSIRLVP